MRWSWRLGRFAGIDVYMHATFLLIIGWVVLVHWMDGQGLPDILMGVLFILALFACVVLHEFGHALTARRYGIRTRDITLLPIGGLARLERMPDDPRQELWVALAGPVVNVVIALVLFFGLHLTASFEPLDKLGVSVGSFWERLMVVNIFLVLFNMLPAFPMDGGRVVRALLATRMDYTRATQIAAGLGQGMAFLFGFIGLLTNPFLVFIAFFVWIGAAQEATMVQVKSAFSGVPVSRAMLTNFQILAPNESLSRAVDLTLAGFQRDFPVVESGRVVGILVQEDLFRALAEQRQDTSVSEVMKTEFATADVLEMLETVFQRLQSCQCRTVPVFRLGKLAGLVTMDNLGEFLAIQSALSGSRAEGLAAALR